MAKPKKQKKNSMGDMPHFGGIGMMTFKSPNPTINKKNIEALKTLMSDPGFKEMLPGSAETMVKAFEAGLNAKKEK